MLASLHHADIPRNRHRAFAYTPWHKELNFEQITFPFTASQLPLFERLNPTLSITLLQWKKDAAHLVRAAPLHPSRRVIHLLLVDEHFVGISNLDRLINSNATHSHHSRYHCQRCLRPFFSIEKRAQHMPFCLKNEPHHYRMPKEKMYTFTKWAKTLSPTHVIYADIECLLETGEGSTLQNHQPIAAAYLVVPHKSITNRSPIYRQFVGRHCIPELLEALEKEVIFILLIFYIH